MPSGCTTCMASGPTLIMVDLYMSPGVVQFEFMYSTGSYSNGRMEEPSARYVILLKHQPQLHGTHALAYGLLTDIHSPRTSTSESS